MRSCPQCFSAFVTDAEFCRLDGQRIVETDVDPLIGRTIDRYEILERLGHGGMSVVYRARHQVIGHEYALKIPYGEMAADREFSERLRREAQTAAKLDHPNVIHVFDFATTPSGSCFLLMELAPGRSLLRAILDDGRMNPADSIRILRQVALGLAVVHEQGFVHRDMKPGNVMLVGEKGAEVAKILDFGLVRISQNAQPNETLQATLTQNGVVMGTIFYMSPEQTRGEPATALSDIFALGAVLFEMLTGMPPYRGSLGDILVQQATQPPPEVPPSGGLENLVRAMLNRDPSKRPQSALDVIESLDRLQALHERPIAAPQPKPKKKVAVALLLTAGIGTTIWLQRDPSGEAVAKSIEQPKAKAPTCSARTLSSRLAGVNRMINRAEKTTPASRLSSLEKRSNALKGALAKKIDDERCRTIARSLSKLELEVAKMNKGRLR